jgi:hypothetical protein
MIQCCICSKELKQITRNHLVRHKLSVAEYRDLYPNAPLQDPSIIKSGPNNPFYGKNHTESTRKILREKASTRIPNPEIGKIISEYWSQPDGNYRKLMSSDDYRSKMSETTKSWWNSASEEDKVKRIEKMRETNERNKRWLSSKDKDPFVLYRDEVRKLSNENFLKNFYSLENSHLRGKGFDLDHVVSIREGYDKEIPAEIIASVPNLRIIPSSENKRKSRKSHMTCENLLRIYKECFANA